MYPQHPTPSVLAQIQTGENIVGKIGNQDTEDDVELIHRHQASAFFGRRDFGNIGRRGNSRCADAQAADEAEEGEGIRVVDQGRTERTDHIQRADDDQRFFTPEFIGRYAAKERADDRPPKRG